MMNNLDLIKNDVYLNRFITSNKITDEQINDHINLFLRVLNSRNKCANCNGLCMCKQKSSGERLDISFNEALLEEVEYCEYKQEENKTKNIINSYVYSNIPIENANQDLDTIMPTDDEKGLYVQLYDILDGRNNKGLYICGDMGVGKTYLTTALANSLVKSNKKVAFVKIASFVNEMRDYTLNDSSIFESYMNKLKKVQYLFIDDLGSETVSSFVRDTILFTLLDYRMENKLTTIFTSNLNKSDLLKHYTFDKKDNSSILRAKRLAERIDLLGSDYVLVGTNKRRKSC